MLEKYGRKGSEVKGVFFTEGQIDGGQQIGEATTSSDRQNIALDILKEKMADQVLAKGGNALDNFKYVQKGSAFSFSSTRWVLTGRIIKIENP
jgi:hypothetical protein